MEPAPIVIPVYSRLLHLKQTIASILNNSIAKDTIVVISSDGPKTGDEEKVKAVRDFCQNISGFKSVELVFHPTNIGAFSNAVFSISKALETYGQMINMEEDNVVSPYFLDYMNNALDYFRGNERILAISGYNYPIGDRFKKYTNRGYFISHNFNGWGWATWNNRGVSEILADNDFYYKIIANRKLVKRVNNLNPSIIPILKQVPYAGDCKLSIKSILETKYIIRPVYSYVRNIGNDGSGEHCSDKGSVFDTDLDLATKDIRFSSQNEYIPELDELITSYYIDASPSPPLYKRVLNKLRTSFFRQV
jgi:hypothetical protein